MTGKWSRPVRYVDRHWKAMLVFLVLVFAVSSLLGTLAATRANQNTSSTVDQLRDIAYRNRRTNVQNTETLRILREVTSEDARAASNAALAAAIAQIDCRSQRTVQRAVDALAVEAGSRRQTTVITPACVQFFVEHPEG